MSRIIKKIILLISLSLIFFVSCYKKEKIKKEKIVVVTTGSKPKSLDPYKYNEFPALIITEQVYNNLITLDDNGNIIPELAKKFEYISPKEIVLELRNDVLFHNGNKFVAEDVVFSFDRMKKSVGTAEAISNIEKVEKISDYKVKITLKNISSTFLANLSSPLFAIMNKKFVEENLDKADIIANGTGPFSLETWDGKDKFIFHKNSNYFKGSPKIDKLIFWVVPETANRAIALETGEADISFALSMTEEPTIRKNNKLAIDLVDTATTDYIALNTQKGNLKNLEYRQAINFAINKKSLVKAFYGNYGIVAETIVNPKILGSIDDKLENQNYNPEKAKEILSKLNLPKEKISLWISNSPQRMQIAQVVQADLKKVGIEVEINSVEWGTFLQMTAEGKHDMLISTWYISAPEASTILNTLVSSKNIGAGGNRSFYSNNLVDNLLKNANEDLNLETRLEYYKKVQEILNNDMPIIPIAHKKDFISRNKKIIGLRRNKSTLRTIFEEVDVKEE